MKKQKQINKLIESCYLMFLMLLVVNVFIYLFFLLVSHILYKYGVVFFFSFNIYLYSSLW